MKRNYFLFLILFILIPIPLGQTTIKEINDQKKINYLLKRKLYYTSLFILKKKNLRLRKKRAVLKKIWKETNPLSSQFFEGILFKKNEREKFFKEYKKCSFNKEMELKTEKILTLKEQCKVNMARTYYKGGQFKKGLSLLNEISIDQAFWPYLLKEKAWFQYKLKNYNKVLGLIVTYQSPLLKNYDSPETTYLTVLSYYKLCLYQDAFFKSKKYLVSYTEKQKRLNKKILSIKNQPEAFLRKLKSKITLRDFKTRFIIINLLKKKSLMESELQALKKFRRIKERKKMMRFLSEKINMNKKKILNYFLKKWINKKRQLKKYKRHILSLKSEMMKKRRYFLYEHKSLSLTKKRGRLENIIKNKKKEFYSFKNSFWADELGHYQFGLKNQCPLSKKGRL
jgi:hypothetical protein